MPDLDPTPSPAGRRTRRPVLLAVLLGLLLLGVGGVVAYRLSGPSDDDDPGVTACRSAGVVVRADRGEEADSAELTRVGQLFQRSGHEDLKASGVLAIGLVQRVQDPRNAGLPGTDLYRSSLRKAVPQLVTACGKHGVTVGA